MTIRTLGDLAVAPIGFGAMVLSPGMYGDIDEDRAVASLNHAVDSGATLIDTSDGYGHEGYNETLIGKGLAGRRDEVVLATKFGFRIPPGAEQHSFPVRYEFGEMAVNCDPALIPGYVEESLRRLNTDHIDLYYPHFPDPQVPYAETIGAVARLVEQGKVRHLGVSNVTAAQLREAHAVHPVSAVQGQWSMWSPIDPELLATARELGVGVVAWSPLGGGFLTGAVTTLADSDFRRNIPRFSQTNLAANVDRYAPVRAIAEQLGIQPGQLALAWLLHQDEHVVPIPGSRTPAHIEENLAAVRITLSRDDLERIDAALASIQPAGDMSIL